MEPNNISNMDITRDVYRADYYNNNKVFVEAGILKADPSDSTKVAGYAKKVFLATTGEGSDLQKIAAKFIEIFDAVKNEKIEDNYLSLKTHQNKLLNIAENAKELLNFRNSAWSGYSEKGLGLSEMVDKIKAEALRFNDQIERVEARELDRRVFDRDTANEVRSTIEQLKVPPNMVQAFSEIAKNYIDARKRSSKVTMVVQAGGYQNNPGTHLRDLVGKIGPETLIKLIQPQSASIESDMESLIMLTKEIKPGDEQQYDFDNAVNTWDQIPFENRILCLRQACELVHHNKMSFSVALTTAVKPPEQVPRAIEILSAKDPDAALTYLSDLVKVREDLRIHMAHVAVQMSEISKLPVKDIFSSIKDLTSEQLEKMEEGASAKDDQLMGTAKRRWGGWKPEEFAAYKDEIIKKWK